MFGSAIGSLAGAQSNYNQGSPNVLSQPREIGIMQRVEGLRSGLEHLRGLMAGFSDRLNGLGSGGDANKTVSAVGLQGNLSEAEEHLRCCIAFVNELNDKF